ncbi:AraC family transcriptional regulator [Paenibacillus qinlingensis]|uniref:AraC-like DNA-binding protein n=1 Tax=Paenibacillus qinlingensis TaxID=1837343 RepID=A0ABU1P0E1_9BACL|nr:AraC family transcriptional regulator [Paenibacillus qinlingensis]MDR6553178.1 AraC-like DNA-binding protein [Paenibacillus qinlingensis]
MIYLEEVIQLNLIKDFQLNHEPIQMTFHSQTTAYWDIYHAHQGMEFIYVHQGEGSVIIDPFMYEIKPNTLLFFQPYQLHRIKMDLHSSTYNTYERSKFLFEPSIVDNLLSTLPNMQSFFRTLWKDTLTCQVLYLPELASSWDVQLKQLDNALLSTPKEEHMEEFAIFLIGFLQGLRAHWPDKQDSTSANQRPMHHVEHIMKWIDEHYQNPFKLEELAESLHLNTTHVSHLFRKFSGSSITEYLTAKRLREACWLLRTTSEPVHIISSAVGLSNVSYFCQLFKTHIGTSPHQYRKNSTHT